MRSFDEQLDHLIAEALNEDIGEGDHSTLSCIPPDATGKALLKVKQDGIIAGIDVARKIFAFLEPAVHFNIITEDGSAVKQGDVAFTVEASMPTLLQCERLVLNTLQRMSGIATLTRRYVNELQGFHTQILDTRKTTPNFRLLEKEAVRIGGGGNHRFGLYDMILLKDNHIDFCGGITAAIERAYNYVQQNAPHLLIEVEARTLEDVRLILGSGKVNRIMLDNFSPELALEAVELIGGRMQTEASGGIHLDNIQAYARTGVDYISVGALVHQAQSLDLSLKALVE